MPFKHLFVTVVLAVFTVFGAARAAAEPLHIVGFGDSLMAGYLLDAGQSFPERLEAALNARGHDVRVTNAGVSGDTTSAGLARLDWSVPDDADLVILELGANDMLRGVSPEVTERNLDAIMARLEERGIAVVLAGMFAAPNLGTDYIEAFNAIYPALAERYAVPLYPFFLDGVAAERSMLLEDGMHPNAAGVERMVEGALPVVEQAIAGLAGRS